MVDGDSDRGYVLVPLSRWIDFRPSNPGHADLLRLMEARVAAANATGCQAIEFDNVDCWLNPCIEGVPAGSSMMYAYQLQYNKFLASLAHKYGMAAGLKVRVGQPYQCSLSTITYSHSNGPVPTLFVCPLSRQHCGCS